MDPGEFGCAGWRLGHRRSDRYRRRSAGLGLENPWTTGLETIVDPGGSDTTAGSLTVACKVRAKATGKVAARNSSGVWSPFGPSPCVSDPSLLDPLAAGSPRRPHPDQVSVWLPRRYLHTVCNQPCSPCHQSLSSAGYGESECSSSGRKPVRMLSRRCDPHGLLGCPGRLCERQRQRSTPEGSDERRKFHQ